MVLIKVKKDCSGGNCYLKNALAYVFGKGEHQPFYLNGNGVDLTSVNAAYEQMYDVKKYSGKTSGNPLVHLIVSYDNAVHDPETACLYTDEIAEFFSDRFQTLQCTHCEEQAGGKSLYHTHIIANSVSFSDGKMFRSGRPDLQGFCSHVEQVTGQKAWLTFEPSR